MSADANFPDGPKWILMNFPWNMRTQTHTLYNTLTQNRLLRPAVGSTLLTKREELSLRMVLALPNASMAGFASMIWSSKEPWIHSERRSLGTAGIRPMYMKWQLNPALAVGLADKILTKIKWNKLTPFFTFSPKAATMAKYCITLLVLTVFPAPDSPLRGWRWGET